MQIMAKNINIPMKFNNLLSISWDIQVLFLYFYFYSQLN